MSGRNGGRCRGGGAGGAGGTVKRMGKDGGAGQHIGENREKGRRKRVVSTLREFFFRR